MIVDLTSTEIDPVSLVVEAERVAREHMEPQRIIWQETIDAYRSRGPVDDAESVSVKINHLLPVIETIVPRDATALLPQRPYIPIKTRKLDQQKRGRFNETIIDAQLDRGQFFPSFVNGLRMAEAYGCSYLEPYWDAWVENIYQRNPITDPMTGQIVGFNESRTSELRDGLAFKALGPWAVLPHPAGNTLLSKPWIIIKELVHVSEIIRMVESGRWQLPEEVTPEDLKKGPIGRSSTGEWEFQWRMDRSGLSAEAAMDVGVLLRLYSENRWIYVWNYSILLQDTENQHVNMDRRVKPVAMLRMSSDIGPDQFFPPGHWARIRDKAMFDDAILSLYIDKLLMDSAKWIVYDERYIDPEQLVATYGGRVRVKNNPQSMDQAVKMFEMGRPDPSMLDVHNILKQSIDDQTGVQDIARGVNVTPKQTATVGNIMAEAAQTRIGFGARYFEGTFMPELAYLVTKLCGRWMTLPQMADVVGFDGALAVMTPDPEAIPGGFTYEFDGSDRVARREQKQNKLKEAWNMVGNHPIVAGSPVISSILIKNLLEGTEALPDSDWEKIEQELDPQFQMQKQMEQQQAAMMQGGGMPPGGMPPGGVQSVGAEGALQNPNTITEGGPPPEMAQMV